MATVRAISDQLVGEVITLDDVIDLIERSFAADARGEHRNFPVVRERLQPAHNGIFGIKAGIAGSILGFKAGGFWAGNRERGILPHQSTMVLFDPDSGQPIALVSANRITGLRTGAAGAVAAKYLARPDSHAAAVIGCGAQGRMQLRALARVMPLQRVRVWDKFRESAISFAEELGAETGIAIEVAEDPRMAVEGVDIVVTATPGDAPVLMNDWIQPGMHVTAIGADTAGKQELETKLLVRATLVVDNHAQALTLGESQHLPSIGIDPGAAIHAELGEIVAGMHPGRTRPDEITVFDATGVTFEDLVVAGEVFSRCENRNLGQVVEL